jgi:hypothetical protein
MSKLPDHEIEPLSPPPGSFDQVVKTAKARRRRRGMAVASSVAALVLVSGASFALGSSMSVTERIISAAQGFTDSATTPTVTPAATNQASPKRSATKTEAPEPSPTAASGAGPITVTTPVPISFLRGRVVDPEGQPVAGLYVQPGAADHATFRSTGVAAAVTDDQGEFKIPCPRAPVLLSTWQLNRVVTATAVGRDWAATFVGGSQINPVVPGCGTGVKTTIISHGATITGTVQVAGVCPASTFALAVWLGGDLNNVLGLDGLREGDTFRFSGLPAGTHVLDAQGRTKELDLPPGGALEQDATFTCLVTPGPGTTTTPEPTPTSTAATPTPSGLQTGGPTTEPAQTPDG